MIKICLIVGARPNFMKISPIIKELKKHSVFDYRLIHTGQHYDKNMSSIFFEELNIPFPDINLNIDTKQTQIKVISEIMVKLEKYFLEYFPDYVLVVGDVNSTLAAGITASKMGIKLIHVEAGLRSFNNSMPEEINRIIVDKLSDILLVSEPSGIENLKKENITENVYLVGNTMIDSLVNNLDKLKAISYKTSYCVVTIHRPSNVDNKDDLLNILSILDLVKQKGYNIIWPIHPRTKNKINQFDLTKRLQNYIIKDPLGYLEFISIVKHSNLVVTDSGGIQEETTYLNIPCITLRYDTERPITVSKGTNFLTGPNKESVNLALNKIKNKFDKFNSDIEYWDGNTAKRIVNILKGLDR